MGPARLLLLLTYVKSMAGGTDWGERQAWRRFVGPVHGRWSAKTGQREPWARNRAATKPEGGGLAQGLSIRLPSSTLRKHQENQENDGQTGSRCLDKAVLARDPQYQKNKCHRKPACTSPKHNCLRLTASNGTTNTEHQRRLAGTPEAVTALANGGPSSCAQQCRTTRPDVVHA